MKRGELERRVIYYEEVLATLDLLSLDEKAIARMKAEIEKITFELGQLGAFTRMNYTGVLKILKKHDKHTKYLLKPTYMVKFNIDPIQVSNLDELVYRLSKLYSMLSMPSSSTDLTSDQGAPRQASSQEFVRRTTKYWVHPDNVVDVKLIIMKNLPVLVYQGKKGEYDPSDSAISSVYLDNENLELYHGRLEKTEGAEAIRLRWYGGEAPKEVNSNSLLRAYLYLLFDRYLLKGRSIAKTGQAKCPSKVDFCLKKRMSKNTLMASLILMG